VANHEDSFYARWRVRSGAVAALREDRQSPPESLLQAIWQHQRLIRDRLQTLEGETLRVLHPGFRSVEGGPDFRGAVVQIAGGEPASGDIEVDVKRAAWKSHGHDKNPAFSRVILHVIWEADRAPAGTGWPAAMSLRPVLDATLGELSLWLGTEPEEIIADEFRGKCSAPLKALSPEKLDELLRQAAMVRLRGKAAWFQARARQAGWEQALWEGLFRALGYKNNVWPMQRLAELRPRWWDPHQPTLGRQARLFGISGLLPGELTRSQAATDSWLRRVWDQWWREREEYSDCLVPKTLWQLGRQRPANHPHRRLALASLWSANGSMATRLEDWCSQETAAKALPSSLMRILEAGPDEYWSWHLTLNSARLKSPRPMIGQDRVSDVAMNTILPWLWMRASEGRNQEIQQEVERRYFGWPSAEDNSLLRLARQRLLGGAPEKVLRGAAAQQGLIQIVRDFCDRSNALCDRCAFPELVKEFSGKRRGEVSRE
jgi:hypothetical protein